MIRASLLLLLSSWLTGAQLANDPTSAPTPKAQPFFQVHSSAPRTYIGDVNLDGVPAAYAVIFPFVVEILGVIIFVILKHYRLPIPYAACMFVLGVLMGLGAVTSGSSDQLSMSILQWANIDSNVLLLVFLPGLLFRDAIEVNFDLFLVSLPQTLILAFPMVLMGTFMVVAIGVYIFASYDFSWTLWATLGAILSSTDPVAVASVLNEAGAPPRLKMHIGGESLLNDGSAVVFYTIFSDMFLYSIGYGETVSVGEGFATFFKMSLGGMAVGIAFAIGLLGVLHELDRRLDPEYNVLQVVAAVTVAYLSYYVADQVAGMSGIIACVVCGITSSALGKGLINDAEMMDSYLALMEYMLNTLLFALGGAEWGAAVFSRDGWNSIYATDWGYLVALYVLGIVARFIQVAVVYPVFSRIGLGSNWQESVFLAYAGLRGAVGIALAVALIRRVMEDADSYDNTYAAMILVFMSGGVSMGTLLINGTTAGPVLRLLGLAKPEASRDLALDIFESAARDFVAGEFRRLLRQPRFHDLNHAVVEAHVPFLKEGMANSDDFRESSVSMSSSIQMYDDAEEDPHSLRLQRASAFAEDANTALVEIRGVFLEMLNEAYATALLNGELEDKADNGLTLEPFKQSVEFAAADVEKVPLNDWEYLQIFPVHNAAGKIIRRRVLNPFTGSLFRRRRGSEPKIRRMSASLSEEHHQLTAIRAAVFVRAHRLAGRRLQQYVKFVLDSGADISSQQALTEALETVLEESRVEIAEAERVFDSLSHNKRSMLMAHYVVSILLRRLERFIELNAAEGALTTDEARLYLEAVEQAMPGDGCQDACACLPEGQHSGSCALDMKSASATSNNGNSMMEKSDEETSSILAKSIYSSEKEE